MAKKRKTTDPLELLEEEFRRLEREELAPKKKKKKDMVLEDDEEEEPKKKSGSSKFIETRNLPSTDSSFLMMSREEYLNYLTHKGSSRKEKEEMED